MFSVATLDEDQARQIAEAYIKGDRDPPRVASLLGVDRFDLNLVMHPLVRGHVVRLQRNLAGQHSLEEHLTQLKKIRDAAFDDENFKVALAAETQIGKAAGLYEPKLQDEIPDGQPVDPSKLSTEELRRRLAQQIGAVIPVSEAQDLLPGSLESQEQSESNEL